jgi:hypothetical protein
MTISASDGPIVTKGWQAALGSASGTSSATGAPNAYVSGTADNPDAGPNVFYDGVAMKDAYYRYQEGGGSLSSSTGYKNQACGFVENMILTADFVPSQISTTNVSALAAPTIATPVTLAAGTGTAIETASQVVLNTGLTVPSGVLRIDAAPTWQSFGTSGAIRGWNGAGVGRALSFTSGGNASAVTFRIRGYDIYGNPVTEDVVGPSGNTVNSAKCYKWILSITPNATSAQTVSIGTADIFEFPIRADRFSTVTIYVNETLITANTGFVAAVLTDPATAVTGDVRGTYALQTPSDGVERLVIYQRMGPARLNTNPPSTGMFGPAQFSA